MLSEDLANFGSFSISERAGPGRAEEVPREEQLREPDADEAEAARRRADGELVRVHGDGEKVAQESAEEVDGNELVHAELLLHAKPAL